MINELENLIKRTIDHEWATAKTQINDFLSRSNQADFNKIDKELLENFIHVVDLSDMTKSAENIFKTLNNIGNIDSQLDVLCNFSTLQTTSSLIVKIKNSLKKMTTHLWQYLSQMVNLDNWAISGNAGISTFFGLSGQLGVTVTFKG